jgi:hypothetical protein
MSEDDKLARRRFMLLNLVRLAGLAMVLVAIAIHYGKLSAPEAVAYVLAIVGLADFFFMPNVLARKWRTPSDPGDE